MPQRNDGAVYELPSDTNPIFVGVDYGNGDVHTECEIEVLPNGVMKVLDIRETPTKEFDPGN